MAKLRTHFGGYVERMDAREADIRIDNVHPDAHNVQKGDVVKALTDDFMKQMPGPCVGAYVEGNVEHDTETGQNRFINIVRPV